MAGTNFTECRRRVGPPPKQNSATEFGENRNERRKQPGKMCESALSYLKRTDAIKIQLIAYICIRLDVYVVASRGHVQLVSAPT
jgi:hypothetical protein